MFSTVKIATFLVLLLLMFLTFLLYLPLFLMVLGVFLLLLGWFANISTFSKAGIIRVLIALLLIIIGFFLI